MDVVGIVEGLRPTPDDGKCGTDVGRARSVGKLHLVAINDVAQKLRIHRCHSPLDVELANKASLNDERGDVVHFDFDRLVDARRNEDFRAPARSRIDLGAKVGSRSGLLNF